MRVGNRLLLATALVTLVGGSGGLAAEGALRPECLSFVLRELQPGQRFQDVRKRRPCVPMLMKQLTGCIHDSFPGIYRLSCH